MPEWLAQVLPVQRVKVLVPEWVWLPELPERMVMELGLVREPVSLGQRVKVRELVQE